MRKLMLVIVVLGLAGPLWAADNPDIGTWKLNLAQSKGIVHAPKELTWVFRAIGDQMEVTATGIEADGSPISYKLTYPQAGGAVTILASPAAGAPAGPPPTIIVTIVSPNRKFLTLLKDGKQQEFQDAVISEDGKTKRIRAKGNDLQGEPVDSLEVWDRQ